jgi:hypothetical protein
MSRMAYHQATCLVEARRSSYFSKLLSQSASWLATSGQFSQPVKLATPRILRMRAVLGTRIMHWHHVHVHAPVDE